jgi:hypothetical protein
MKPIIFITVILVLIVAWVLFEWNAHKNWEVVQARFDDDTKAVVLQYDAIINESRNKEIIEKSKMERDAFVKERGALLDEIKRIKLKYVGPQNMQHHAAHRAFRTSQGF